MDQLNFKGVSGLTIDEGDDKPKQRWMAKGGYVLVTWSVYKRAEKARHH